MGKHVASVTFRSSNFSAVTFAGFQRSFDAQQLSSTRSIGVDRVVYLSGSGIFTCQQQHGLQILSRQLLLGLSDSQSLCLRTRLSDRALFWEAQLLIQHEKAALEASLIARIAAHTPFPTWTLRNSHLKTSNSPVRRFGGPELRQRQHIRRFGRLMTRCTLITDGDSNCKASWVDSSWHPVGGLLALVFTGARPLTILLADTDFLLVDARCIFSSWTPFACLYHVT